MKWIGWIASAIPRSIGGKISSQIFQNKNALTGTAQSITLAGLDFATNKRYRVHFSIITTSTSTTDNLRMSINGDNTASHYNAGATANTNVLFASLPANVQVSGWIDIGVSASGRIGATVVCQGGINVSTNAIAGVLTNNGIITHGAVTPTSVSLYMTSGTFAANSYIEAFIA